ncbi:MAG: hypothetical protein JXA01_03170 [Dehalococcoidia bacterium]|nr:hypothetical protein [Dehalococcoidia bacterium]
MNKNENQQIIKTPPKKSAPAPLKDRVLYGALTIIAGVLTVIALVCVIMFHTSAGFLDNIFTGHGTGMTSMHDKIKVDLENSKLTGANGDLNSSPYIESGYGNVGAGSMGGDSSNEASNAAGDTGESDIASDSLSSLDGGDTTGGDAGSSGDISTGSTGGSDDTSYADDGDGTAGDDDYSDTSSTTTINRIKSACFGGVGRCYVGE